MQQGCENFDFATEQFLKSNNLDNAITLVFNKTIMYLDQEKYKKALTAFKKTYKLYPDKYKIEEQTLQQKIKAEKIKNILDICYLD